MKQVRGEEECALVLVGKSNGKRPLERPKHKWVDNIEMDLRERAGCGMVRIHLVQDSDQWMALKKTLMNLRVP
jgi:hypothetical protein